MSSFALIISYVNGINHQTVSQQLFYFHFLYPYEKYLYQSIGAIYVPYMSPIISIGEL